MKIMINNKKNDLDRNIFKRIKISVMINELKFKK